MNKWDTSSKERLPLKVIVDENAGPGTEVWAQFCHLPMLAEGAEYLFLSDSHPGIPDVEILERLLAAGTVLVTGDRVLHMRATERGFRSYTLNAKGHLTGRRLAGVRTSELPHSVYSELQDDYRHQPDGVLAGKLKAGFTEKQFKRYRTARRRIRSHFGSAAAISQVSVTIGAALTEGGLLCGFVFHLAGNSGAVGLRASEGYCRPANGLTDPACPVIHALRDQYLLQLEQVRTDLFIVPPPALELCRGLMAGNEPAEPLHQTLRELLREIPQLTLHPCIKGRFFDAMQRKLHQLQRGHSNEINELDFHNLAVNVLGQ